jgi:hypothetical protein
LKDVERVPEVLPAVVFHMVEAEGVRKQAVTRELRAERCTARPMGVDAAVNSLVAQKVQKVAQISVLPMVAGGDAVVRVVLGLPEENLVCASDMVGVRDARKKIAQRVQKVYLVSAFLMEVVGDANSQDAPRGHKGAPCYVRHMVGGNAALLQDAPRVLKGALLFVKATEEEKGVPSNVVGFVVRVYMEGPTSASHMGVERGVLYLSAQRVQEDVQIFVSVMAVEKGARLKDVVKVLKAAPISARHMVEGRDALGVILGQNMVTYLLVLVPHLQGVRQVSVHFTAVWCRTRGFMVVSPWDLWSRTLKLVSLRRRKKLSLSRT